MPPSRLAPCTETQAHSPAAYRPGSTVRPEHVRVDAAHVVVRAGPHRDRLVDRVDAGVIHRQLARPVQPLHDLRRAQVGEVEQHAAVDAAALVDLGLLGPRHDVARGELAARSARS